jgi:4a-hydroxytetrahydrobiopterin dehydratase
VREFERPGGFMGALAFVNQLADVAETLNHHPDIAISWNRVTVTIGSHRLGGVTEQCFQLAAEADRLAA